MHVNLVNYTHAHQQENLLKTIFALRLKGKQKRVNHLPFNFKGHHVVRLLRWQVKAVECSSSKKCYMSKNLSKSRRVTQAVWWPTTTMPSGQMTSHWQPSAVKATAQDFTTHASNGHWVSRHDKTHV